MNIIETKHLTKTYRRFQKDAGIKGSIKSLFKRKYVTKTAVSDFDFTVQEGEFVGLIGPNGAGKTTLVKMLTGIIAPSSGEISVVGHYPNNLENAFKKQYAVVMGQKSQLFFELSAADTFLLFKELYHIPEEEYQKNLEYFIELFGVTDILNVQVRTLSLGERMKLELIVALLHNPKILFLDEPTIGLDAVAQKQIRRFLKDVNETKGTTIILTSHYMEDIKLLCKRCVVINHGVKLYDGATDTLFHKYQMVPLILLPKGIVDGMKFLPFYYLTYLPSMLLIGRNGEEILLGLTVLPIWIVIFVLLNKFTYQRLRVRYDGVGI